MTTRFLTLRPIVLVLTLSAALLAACGDQHDNTTTAAATTASPSGAPADGPSAAADQLARGRYLVKAADCAACHTAADGAPFAGGVKLASPFGTFYGTNITPDKDHGIGKWSAGDFYRLTPDANVSYAAGTWTHLAAPPAGYAPYASAEAVLADGRVLFVGGEYNQDKYGEPFAHELLETISDWSDFWLNDRELARRPWVYNPASSQVDALLMETSEAAAKLQWRLFPETYSIHRAEEKAQ